MARALLVGCGCCARLAGTILAERGWAVRGTSRQAGGAERIEAAGLEGVVANPDRIGSIIAQCGEVTVLAWLLGSARGPASEVAALHTDRLESLLAKLVDTPVRGIVYEAAGSAPERALADGRALVAAAAERWRIPVRELHSPRAQHDAWARDLADLTASVVGAG